MPGVQVKFTLNSRPQIAEDRAFHLAWFHLAGFFYWITYDPEAKRGALLAGAYMPLLAVRDPVKSLRTLVPTPEDFGRRFGLKPISPGILSSTDASFFVRADLRG